MLVLGLVPGIFGVGDHAGSAEPSINANSTKRSCRSIRAISAIVCNPGSWRQDEALESLTQKRCRVSAAAWPTREARSSAPVSELLTRIIVDRKLGSPKQSAHQRWSCDRSTRFQAALLRFVAPMRRWQVLSPSAEACCPSFAGARAALRRHTSRWADK